MSAIRVLVVLPFYGGSLPIGRYCVEALEANGCIVDVFEAPAYYSSYLSLHQASIRQDRREFLESSMINLISEIVLAQVESFGADLVLCMAQAPMSRKALLRLKSMEIPTAMWFVEDYQVFSYWRAFAPLYDIFAVIQKEPFIAKLNEIGVSNILYLPLAAHPNTHKSQELTSGELSRFGANVSFMGAGYANRRNIFAHLLDYDFKIWGSDWDGETNLKDKLQLNGMRISTEDSVKIFNATSVNLNLHSSIRADEPIGMGDFVNPRTFELAACGAFQLVDSRSLLSEIFEDDELAIFTSVDDLKEKIDYYLINEDERKSLALKAQAKVLAMHTYDRRMESLLNFAKDKLDNFPKPKAHIHLPEEMPEELKVAIKELMVELDLNPNCSFEDVVVSIKKKSGILTPLESSLLFLDSWKTQYLGK